jgi:hypothetical protein
MAKKITFCKNHPEKQVRAKKLCQQCYMNQLYKKNPIMRQKARNRTNAYRKNNLEKVRQADREKHLKKKFNIGISEYESLQSAQNNLCAICKNPETTSCRGQKINYLAVDHCHRSGVIRGLLCFKCNTAISIIENTPNILESIREYLKL